MKYWKQIVSVALGLGATNCGTLTGEKEGEKTCRCSVFSMSEPLPGIYDNMRSASGSIRLDPIPLSLEGARFFFLVDELSIYSEERVRIIEKEFEMVADQYENMWKCGTNDSQYNDSGSSPESQSCNCKFALGDTQRGMDSRFPFEAYLSGDLSVQDSLNFSISYRMPDSRSQYFIGLLVDMDGDGVASDGDYYSDEFVELNENSTNNVIKVNQVKKPVMLLSGKVTGYENAAFADGATIRFEVIDSSANAVVAARSYLISEFAGDFAIQGNLLSRSSKYALKIFLDSNGNGVTDQGDFSQNGIVEVITFGHPDRVELDLLLIED